MTTSFNRVPIKAK